MQAHAPVFLHDLHRENLSVIQGITFTPREIDVISCLINLRGNRKIAALVSVSPSTISSHINNIKLKIGGNSREKIIDFVEQSSMLPSLRQHYGYLVVYAAFEKALNAIKKENAKVKKQTIKTYIMLYGENHVYKDLLLQHLGTHLKQAGINVDVEIKEPNTNLGNNATALKSKSQSLILLLETVTREQLPKILWDFDTLDISAHQTYYFLIFEILQKLLPHVHLDHFLNTFVKQSEGMLSCPNEIKTDIYKIKQLREKPLGVIYKLVQNFRNNYSYFLLSVIFSISLVVLMVSYFGIQCLKGKKEMQVTQLKESPICSRLIIPVESMLLGRPEEFAKIENVFENQNNEIQTVALVGPGGAGKTTLARQFAHQQIGANVIWELNAETHENLISSFEALATALAKTEISQKILRALQEVKNSTERAERIIQFVKESLKSSSDWVLIFDNVENFIELQKYLPQDTETWGQGKVILTTRDTNIETNQHIHFILAIEELSQPQKLTLFTKIMAHGNTQTFTPTQMSKAVEFLENIPSFPLDVSVAAYYIKITRTPYPTYLENLRQNNQYFQAIQEKLLRGAGNYSKTRCGIISLSLQNLIETEKDFGDLMLFISLLDSQNIPRDLLNQYKSPVIVDNFFYNLKKYSLIMPEFANDPDKTSALSLHRNVQEISLAYLTQLLNSSLDKELVHSMAQTLEHYLLKMIEKEDLSAMKLFAHHCEMFLSYNHLLTSHTNGALGTHLGNIYFFLGDYQKAKKILETSFEQLSNDDLKNNDALPKNLVLLGNIERELGNYKRAENFIEQALDVYKKYLPENYADITLALGSLGNIHRSAGDNEKAKNTLEQALAIGTNHLSENHPHIALVSGYLGVVEIERGDYEKAKDLLENSLMLYKELYPENQIKIAWASGCLGRAYEQLADYEKAKYLLEHTLITYQANYPEDHEKSAWSLAHLGNVYRELGEHEKAKNLLEQSFEIYKKLLKSDHPKIGWVACDLGRVYLHLGLYEKAKELIEKAFVIYKEYFSENHVYTADILRSLGQAYLLEGNLAQAEKFLQQSLTIYQKEEHLDIYAILENMAELYLKKSTQALEEGNAEDAKNFKNQAIAFLDQALKIIKLHFPIDSPHILRIEAKQSSF